MILHQTKNQRYYSQPFVHSSISLTITIVATLQEVKRPLYTLSSWFVHPFLVGISFASMELVPQHLDFILLHGKAREVPYIFFEL